MTDKKQQRFQEELNNLIGKFNIKPDEAIGMFVSAALGIMGQIYRKPDGSNLSPDEVKLMMVQGIADSVQKKNGVGTELTILDTPEAAADHLAKAAKDAANLEGAKPISVEDAQDILEQQFKPPGSELTE